MSKRGKKKDEDYASEDEEPNKRPKKSSKADDSDDAADDIVVCEISKNRRVSVRNWQGRVVVDIREFYVKDGKQLPGKKGISLTMDQWNLLREHVDEIDKAVAENS
ncbi:RNA polymerase II transcriptional coactivator KIWI-like [Coffea eugenioides]|uniref:RNA polymerase II transcriptional coactivator KIWI-like n=1 Tax=Coffea eugenioides TaxID=49369 RepID=UPI000F609C67|nr:RNA polymerase II transcriptional coactivator KIWI-like [Coffea eugenioides]